MVLFAQHRKHEINYSFNRNMSKICKLNKNVFSLYMLCSVLQQQLTCEIFLPINSSPANFHVPFFVTKIDEGQTFRCIT